MTPLLVIVTSVLSLCHCDYVLMLYFSLLSRFTICRSLLCTKSDASTEGIRETGGGYVSLPSCINLCLRSLTLSTASKINSRSIPGTSWHPKQGEETGRPRCDWMDALGQQIWKVTGSWSAWGKETLWHVTASTRCVITLMALDYVCLFGLESLPPRPSRYRHRHYG
jgi:hypothetical protein